MKLKTLSIKNIKSFDGEFTFDFSESENINTISGINGSGKTTVFKSIILAQKLFFADQYNSNTTGKLIDFKEDLQNYFSSTSSYIKLEFTLDESTKATAAFTIKCTHKLKSDITVKLEGNQHDLDSIKQFWNIKNPKNLIIYINSNRHYSENDFSIETIKLSQVDSSDLAIEYISHPDKIFFSTYERIIQDYIRERIIPSSPRADLPHIVSKILIHDILDYLSISNFTGLFRENQFTLQVKRRNSVKRNSTYDLRNLSSGEKTLFYIYHFICYIKNIGMLIIDEPENNLHENMLSKFVRSLNDICTDEDFSNLVLNVAQSNSYPVQPKFAKQIQAFYKNHKLSQVFLLTHSKNLVYNNFTIGKNYILDGGLTIINYENYEKKLREIGLSKIINKVLFVEGKTENEILESILSPYNIKIKSLGGCGEVIDTYKRYLKIHQEIRDVQFCFMIDRDTRTELDIQDIRTLNEAFFDEHFIVMERHEIENYFLEAKMFHELYQKHNASYSYVVVPTVQELEDRIKLVATNNKERVLRKKIQNLNQKCLSEIKQAISNKNIPIDSMTEYNSLIDEVFDPVALQPTIKSIKQNYDSIAAIEASWESDWLKLCDGKTVYNNFLVQVSNDLQIQVKRAKKELVEIGLSTETYEINSIKESILSKLL